MMIMHDRDDSQTIVDFMDLLSLCEYNTQQYVLPNDITQSVKDIKNTYVFSGCADRSKILEVTKKLNEEVENMNDIQQSQLTYCMHYIYSIFF